MTGIRNALYIGVEPKKGWFLPPKWRVKIMGKPGKPY